MSNVMSTVADLGSSQSLSILVVGGLVIIATSAIWSAIERYWERVGLQRDI